MKKILPLTIVRKLPTDHDERRMKDKYTDREGFASPENSGISVLRLLGNGNLADT